MPAVADGLLNFGSTLRTAKELIRPFYLKWLFFRLSSANCPQAFRAWRAYTSFQLRRATARHFAPPTQNPDFVFLPMTDWHALTQRSRQLALGLSLLGHRCVYVNPHLGRERTQPYPISRGSVITQLSERVYELHVHVPLEPVFHHRRLRRAEADLIAREVLMTLQTMGSVRQALVVSFPVWNTVAAQVAGKTSSLVVYDSHDLLEGLEKISSDLLLDERAAMDKADAVMFSSTWLMTEHLRRNPELVHKSRVVRNAVGLSNFPIELSRPSGENPTIGYIGYLGPWFDVDSVRAAASARPNWRFVLVGPVSPGFRRDVLLQLKNVTFVGEVPYTSLPDYLRTFDVGLIPFRVEPLTLASNPIKLYEYFAHGIPVVSSPLPEVQMYGDLVYVAHSQEGFLERIDEALSESGEALRARRLQVAKMQTWDERCQALTALIAACKKDS